jgi:hypothetical protein
VKGRNAVFRKNKPILPPFVVQVLTTEYLIEGTTQGDVDTDLFRGLDAWSPLRLTSVQITPTGLAQVPAQFLPVFMVSGNSVVALVPRVELSQMADHVVWAVYKIARPGIFHIGPYLIRGTMMFLREDCVEEVMPMFGVQISHTVPGAALGELSAPFILVNPSWMVGYQPT